jgi:hypothetical protein
VAVHGSELRMAHGGAVRAPLPEGVVTFLLTDVEGSSRLWERDPSSMRAAMPLHDELVRAVTAARCPSGGGNRIPRIASHAELDRLRCDWLGRIGGVRERDHDAVALALLERADAAASKLRANSKWAQPATSSGPGIRVARSCTSSILPVSQRRSPHRTMQVDRRSTALLILGPRRTGRLKRRDRGERTAGRSREQARIRRRLLPAHAQRGYGRGNAHRGGRSVLPGGVPLPVTSAACHARVPPARGERASPGRRS